MFLAIFQRDSVFSLPVWMYRKSYCTTLGVRVGVGGGVGVGKMLTFFTLKFFLCDGQDVDGLQTQQ